MNPTVKYSLWISHKSGGMWIWFWSILSNRTPLGPLWPIPTVSKDDPILIFNAGLHWWPSSSQVAVRQYSFYVWEKSSFLFWKYRKLRAGHEWGTMPLKLPGATILNQEKSKSLIKAHFVNSRMNRQSKSRCFLRSQLSFCMHKHSFGSPPYSWTSHLSHSII